VLALELLSGSRTAMGSMSALVQDIMFAVLAQPVLFRGAGLTVIWPRFIALLATRHDSGRPVGGVLSEDSGDYGMSIPLQPCDLSPAAHNGATGVRT